MSQPPLMDNKMDPNDVDEEDLEDIEISLYGLLHHSANYTLDSHGSSPVTSTSPSPQPLADQPESPECRSPKSDRASSTDTKKGEEPSQCQSQNITNRGSGSIPGLGRKTSPCTATIQRMSHQKVLRKNIFKEYLVIEQETSKAKQKCPLKTVTKITDCEDSKYEDIRKSTRNNTTLLPDNIEDSSSSDDDSIVILDTNQPQPTEESESSDSEVEIIEDFVVDPESRIKLNVRGSHLGDAEEMINGIPVNPEWRKYVCSKWTQEMVDYYDQRKPIIDLDEIQKKLPRSARLWQLDDSDRYGVNNHRNRYFGRSNNRERCTNCQQRDHSVRHCPDPIKQKCCHMCGITGHTHYRCPQKVCLNCGRPSQVFVECCPDCRKERSVICMICKLNHPTQQCPDLWRRYYLTTSYTEELTAGKGELKSSRQLHCCNCATKGHLWFDCKDIKGSKYPVAKPNIFSYEDSKNFLDRVTDGGTKSVVVSDDRKSVWVVGSPPRNNKILSYSFNPAGKIGERRVKLAGAQVMKEVEFVEVTWRVQRKKGRYIVEFAGKGDKHEARKRFKKLIHVQSNQLVESVTPTKSKIQSGSACTTPKKMSGSPNKSDKQDKSGKMNNSNTSFTPVPSGSAAVGHGRKETFIREVAIKYTNKESKEFRCLNKVSLNPAQRKSLGKLMAQCQVRYRVPITSSAVGSKLEIYIGCSKSEVTNQSNQAFLCLTKFLQSVKN